MRPFMSFKPFRCLPGPRDMANKLSSLFKGHINECGAQGNVVYTHANFSFTSALGPFPRGPLIAASGVMTLSTN